MPQYGKSQPYRQNSGPLPFAKGVERIVAVSRSAAIIAAREDTARLLKMAAGLRAETAPLAAERAKKEEEVARRRRSGEAGPDWQRLQQRIDMGRTTFFEIISGLDRSREAARVREVTAQNLTEATAIVREAQRKGDVPSA